MMRIRVIVIGFAMMGLQSSMAHADGPFLKVTVDGHIGYIVSKDHGFESEGLLRGIFGIKSDLFWTPSLDDVTSIEKVARKLIQRAKTHPELVYPQLTERPQQFTPKVIKNLKDEIAQIDSDYDLYQRQYVGVLIDGRKYVFCNYFRFDRFPEAFHLDPSERFIDVNDGGTNYWQIGFELRTNECRNFSVNG